MEDAQGDFGEDSLWGCDLLAVHYGIRLSDASHEDRPHLLAALDKLVREVLQVRHPGMSAAEAIRVRTVVAERARRTCAVLERRTDAAAAAG